MPADTRNPQAPQLSRIGDDALKAKTGKTWEEWFTLLDREGAQKLDHKQIFAIVGGKHQVGDWHAQMVTVGYEQARGLRLLHEKPGGFEISVSKTINIPIGTAFLLFSDGKMRKRWLKQDEFTVRKATENKTVRASWGDGSTGVVVAFYSKGANKTQVVVQHDKLPNSKAADRQKAFWAEQLELLKSKME